MKIAVSTRNFGTLDRGPLDFLEQTFSEVAMNSSGRKLTEDESIELLSGAAGVLAGTEALTEKVFAACPGLKVVSRCGVGLDSVDLEAARKRGIKVLNTPGVLADAVAELTLAMILCCLRNVALSDRDIRKGVWKPIGYYCHHCRVFYQDDQWRPSPTASVRDIPNQALVPVKIQRRTST